MSTSPDTTLDSGADRRDSDRSAILRWEWVLLAAVAIAILVTRLPTLDQPLLEVHGFRQTQTAIQTSTFHEEGIDLLRPEVPVLGEPWDVPFEFPLFQALASIPMSFGTDAEVANRATGLLMFLATALLLWALVRRIGGHRTAGAALVAFAFSPFGILWSRTAMIEYLATAGALAWVLGAIRWRESKDRRWAIASVVGGTVAATVKITTAFAWAPLLLLFTPSRERSPDWRAWVRARLEPVFVAIALLPGLIGIAWTVHADAVKRASEATAWLTSSALRRWNFGTLDQRLDGDAARIVLDRIDELLVGRGWLVVVVLAVIVVKRHRSAWIGMLLVPVVGIGTFYNLYVVHDYYLAAIAPALAATVGLAIVSIADRLPSRLRTGGLAGITAAWLVMALALTQGYWNVIYDGSVNEPESSREIAALTGGDDYVLISGEDWNPKTLFYADRRGLMIRHPHVTQGLVGNQPDLDRYRLLWLAQAGSEDVAYASLRPWYAPVHPNALQLGTDPEELDDAVAIASATTGQAPKEGSELTLEANAVACDGTPLVIPDGRGDAWLGIRITGNGALVPIDGLAPLPPETTTLVFRSDASGNRSAQAMHCTGEGSVSVTEAVEIG